LVHQTEYRCIPTYAKRHDHNHENGKAWTSAQIPTRVPEIAEEMINEIDAARIAAFLLVLLHSIHCAKRRGTSLFRRETSRDFQLDTAFDVKPELLFQFALDKIALE
jgi:hypothetical protein